VDELRKRFIEDGVVCMRGALDSRGLAHAESAYAWTLKNPGPGAGYVLAGKPGEFYQDHSNPNSFPAYRALLRDSGLSDLIAEVIGSEQLWFLYEQIWLKEGADTLRTPWHQDLSYIPVAGEHVVTAWISLDAVPRECALEFVRGSHRGPLFNPTAFDPDNPRAAMYAEGVWPPMPDIEAGPRAFTIVSWETNPGDVIVFHMATLHGGAATRAGGRRRTISLRFFGDDAWCAERPEAGVAAADRLKREDGGRDPIEKMAHMPPGTLFRHPDFERLR
jgi:ectoine hydroxylase-related dioxygenase (phytanoyl-CoA dioxygenase family)